MLDRLLLNEFPSAAKLIAECWKTACHWHAVASPLVWSASFMKLALTSPLILRRCV
ncbi:Uncharacterised protein [Vibrio cholerae]|nr:Uncharacterised protein [Vibrio cholerae]